MLVFEPFFQRGVRFRFRNRFGLRFSPPSRVPDGSAGSPIFLSAGTTISSEAPASTRSASRPDGAARRAAASPKCWKPSGQHRAEFAFSGVRRRASFRKRFFRIFQRRKQNQLFLRPRHGDIKHAQLLAHIVAFQFQRDRRARHGVVADARFGPSVARRGPSSG